MQETEIKLRMPGAEAARALLERSGIPLAGARVFESNLVLDTASRDLRRSGRLLRLRRLPGRAILTYKSARFSDRHKSREEIEAATSEPQELQEILARLGYAPAWRYEKYRAAYRRAADAGHVFLDETPIGVYLELEGPPEWIDATARELGFSESDYILESYGALYLAHCARTGAPPGDMTFAQETASNSQPNPGLSDGRV